MKIAKIILASILMGGIIFALNCAINMFFSNWLMLNLFIKLFILSMMGIFGLATFLFLVTIMKVLNISEVLNLLKKKRGSNVQKTIIDKN